MSSERKKMGICQIIILAVVTLTKTDRLNKKYLPPRVSAGSDFLQAPRISNDHHKNVNAYFGTPINVLDTSLERPQAARDRNAAVLRQDQSIDGDTYSYVYKTDNGIYAEEKGVATNGVRAQGGYSYMGDDGKVYSIRYTADENGFVAQGDHIPTPPPIPKEILWALEQNARDEAAGIFDDGSYDEAKYGYKQQQYHSMTTQPHNYNSYSSATQRMYLPPRRSRNNQRSQFNRLKQIHRYTF